MMNEVFKLLNGGFVSLDSFNLKSFEDMIELINSGNRKRYATNKTDLSTLENNFFCTGNGISVNEFRLNPSDTFKIKSVGMNRCIFFHYNLKEEQFLKEIDEKISYKLKNQHCFIGITQEGATFTVQFDKDKEYNHIIFMLDVSLFKELALSISLNDIEEVFNSTKKISKIQDLPLDGSENILLKDLFRKNFHKGAVKDLYQESKTMELICHTLSKIEKMQNNKIPDDLNKKDIECIKKAKEILLSNLKNSPSLKELSYKSAINEYKLKRGFKALYGTTIYGMLNEVRLNEAKLLIEKEEIDINEVSILVGYKSSSHFSKIFKDRYGVSPKEIKKQRIIN